MQKIVFEITSQVISHHHLIAAIHHPQPQLHTVHYSFDFAQQVRYPSDPLQPGPVYFLTPRKCGVCCEAIPRQTNYLIDEAVDAGKGGQHSCRYAPSFFCQPRFGRRTRPPSC